MLRFRMTKTGSQLPRRSTRMRFSCSERLRPRRARYMNLLSRSPQMVRSTEGQAIGTDRTRTSLLGLQSHMHSTATPPFVQARACTTTILVRVLLTHSIVMVLSVSPAKFQVRLVH